MDDDDDDLPIAELTGRRHSRKFMLLFTVFLVIGVISAYVFAAVRKSPRRTPRPGSRKPPSEALQRLTSLRSTALSLQYLQYTAVGTFIHDA